jgi:hypothetical protein
MSIVTAKLSTSGPDKQLAPVNNEALGGLFGIVSTLKVAIKL